MRELRIERSGSGLYHVEVTNPYKYIGCAFTYWGARLSAWRWKWERRRPLLPVPVREIVYREEVID